MHIFLKRFIFVLAITMGFQISIFGQGDRPETSQLNDPITGVWLGNYSNMRITDKIFWAGELHFRTIESSNTPYIGQVAQLYNRHGIKYMFNKNFNATLGGVLRLDWSPDPGNSELAALIVEPRIWHEYVFAQPFWRAMVYHRLRIEHRWNRTHAPESDWIFRNRWRYKFFMKIPLNKPTLAPGTIYFSPDVEIIMQSGGPVIDSPLEDLRLYPIIGYIVNPRIGVSSGMMYTMGQRLSDGTQYRQRWIFRVNLYLNLDWRSSDSQLPMMQMID